jgi:hypothetical protein
VPSRTLLRVAAFAAVVAGVVPAAAQDARPPPGAVAPSVAPSVLDELPYRKGQQVPQGYRVERAPRLGLVVAGGLTFAVSYAIAVAVAIDADLGAVGEEPAAVPLAGPFIASLGQQSRGGPGDGLVAAALLLDGFAQVAGSVLLAVGLGAQRTYLARDAHQEPDAPLPIQPGLPRIQEPMGTRSVPVRATATAAERRWSPPAGLTWTGTF